MIRDIEVRCVEESCDFLTAGPYGDRRLVVTVSQSGELATVVLTAKSARKFAKALKRLAEQEAGE